MIPTLTRINRATGAPIEVPTSVSSGPPRLEPLHRRAGSQVATGLPTPPHIVTPPSHVPLPPLSLHRLGDQEGESESNYWSHDFDYEPVVPSPLPVPPVAVPVPPVAVPVLQQLPTLQPLPTPPVAIPVLQSQPKTSVPVVEVPPLPQIYDEYSYVLSSYDPLDNTTLQLGVFTRKSLNEYTGVSVGSLGYKAMTVILDYSKSELCPFRVRGERGDSKYYNYAIHSEIGSVNHNNVVALNGVYEDRSNANESGENDEQEPGRDESSDHLKLLVVITRVKNNAIGKGVDLSMLAEF